MQASLNKFAEENKFKSSLEDSKRLSRKDENDHERIMQELFDEKQEKIHEKNNERKRDEEVHQRKMEEGCPPWPCVKMTVFGKSKRTSKVKKENI